MGVQVRVMKLPKGRDPDEIIRADPDAWRRFVVEAEAPKAFVQRRHPVDADGARPADDTGASKPPRPASEEQGRPLEERRRPAWRCSSATRIFARRGWRWTRSCSSAARTGRYSPRGATRRRTATSGRGAAGGAATASGAHHRTQSAALRCRAQAEKALRRLYGASEKA